MKHFGSCVRKIIVWTVCSLLPAMSLVVTLNAENPIDFDQLKKTVVFIYYPDSAGNPNLNAFATGFLVSVPLKLDPSKAYSMIVTARHVVDPEWVGCSPASNPKQIFVRVNLKNFDPKKDQIGAKYLPVALESHSARTWFFNSDPQVDVAVIPLGPQTTMPLDGTPNGPKYDIYDYDVLSIPVSAFATEDELKSAARIGTSVTSPGLVPELSKANRNYPTFKFGRLSNIFGEPIEIPCPIAGRQPKKILGWSVSANFVGGNSGSPVVRFPIDIVGPGGGVMVGGQRAFLLGLVSNSDLGTDFSVITPVDKIFEVIQNLKMDDGDLFFDDSAGKKMLGGLGAGGGGGDRE
jgi:hypothetical protein